MSPGGGTAAAPGGTTGHEREKAQKLKRTDAWYRRGCSYW